MNVGDTINCADKKDRDKTLKDLESSGYVVDIIGNKELKIRDIKENET